ncbi:MAG: hypothetical protein ACLFU4_07140 [Opitutales bacterium]
MNHSAKDRRRLPRAPAVCGLLLALVGGGGRTLLKMRSGQIQTNFNVRKVMRPVVLRVLLFSSFMVALATGSPEPDQLPKLHGLDAVGLERPENMRPRDVSQYASTGPHVYWTDRTLHEWKNERHRGQGRQHFVRNEAFKWGEVSILPSDVDLIEHTYFPGVVLRSRPSRVDAGTMLQSINLYINQAFVNPGDSIDLSEAILLAELFDTDLALDLSEAWLRTAPAEEFLQAYMRRMMVLANSGQLELLESIPVLNSKQGTRLRSPLTEKVIKVNPTWGRFGYKRKVTQELWVKHQVALALGHREEATRTLEEFKTHLTRGDAKKKIVEWWENNKPFAEERLQRLEGELPWNLDQEMVNRVNRWRGFLENWDFEFPFRFNVWRIQL